MARIKCESCRCGLLGFMIILLLVPAFIFSLQAAAGCRFLYRADETPDLLGFYGITQSNLTYYGIYGCFAMQGDSGDWNWFSFDRIFNAATVFAFIACIICGVVMLSSWLLCCFSCPRQMYSVGAIAMLVAFYAQSMTFIVLYSPTACGTGCSLGTDAILSIVACVLIFVVAVALEFSPDVEGEHEGATSSLKAPEKEKETEELSQDVEIEDRSAYLTLADMPKPKSELLESILEASESDLSSYLSQ